MPPAAPVPKARRQAPPLGAVGHGKRRVDTWPLPQLQAETTAEARLPCPRRNTIANCFYIFNTVVRHAPVSGTASFPFRSMTMGFWQILPASARTSGECSVALNSSTCRGPGAGGARSAAAALRAWQAEPAGKRRFQGQGSLGKVCSRVRRLQPARRRCGKRHVRAARRGGSCGPGAPAGAPRRRRPWGSGGTSSG